MNHGEFIEKIHKTEVNHTIHKGKLAQAVWDLVEGKYQELKQAMRSGLVGGCGEEEIEGMKNMFSQLSESYQNIMDNLESIHNSISLLEKRFSDLELKLESSSPKKGRPSKQELLQD